MALRPRVAARPPAVRSVAEHQRGGVDDAWAGDEFEDSLCDDLERPPATESGAASAVREGVEPELSAADGAAGAREELLSMRGAWQYDLGEVEEFFLVRMLGCVWTMTHRGVAADSVGGFAKAGVAMTWCRFFTSLPRRPSFSNGSVGRPVASLLVSTVAVAFCFELVARRDRRIQV